MAGYSGTPLARKLGIKDGSRIFLLNAPGNYLQLVAPLPAGGAGSAANHEPYRYSPYIFDEKRGAVPSPSHMSEKNEAGRNDLGIMAQEIIEGPDRHHRRHHKRGGAPARTC